MFCFPALLYTGSLLPNVLSAPEHPPHLQVAQPHHKQGDQVGQDEVDKVVAENKYVYFFNLEELVRAKCVRCLCGVVDGLHCKRIAHY